MILACLVLLPISVASGVPDHWDVMQGLGPEPWFRASLPRQCREHLRSGTLSARDNAHHACGHRAASTPVQAGPLPAAPQPEQVLD
jgi:hypothetical protein